jgi:hypothetical protein
MQETPLTEWQMQSATPRFGMPAVTTVAPPTDATYTYRAVVPGTVLTTLIHNGIYPDPDYGENNRPEVIPETLARTSFWYRTQVAVPVAYAGRHIWLNFNGINFSSEVWVNGAHVGSTRGAFTRSRFDISPQVHAGQTATIAVLVSPQPHPGTPIEHTIHNGTGKNGGITAIDGPTFLSTIGWDWLPGIRDRDTGIWQRAFLSSTGDVELKNPLITTDLPLPRTDSTDITLKTTVENLTDQPQHGVFTAAFGGVQVHHAVDLAPHESRILTLDPKSDPSFHMLHPFLWWPNGYGPPNLYTLHISFTQGKQGASESRTSDEQYLQFGVRKITYALPGSDNLAISVNGVPVFIRGGDWGLDESLKRIPYDRLEAQFKMHQLANMNMIRNWVGQSTEEDFYALADKYGMLLWDEFFQPNPNDGPNPDDMTTYVANVRDKILHYRNHPSIALWCGRNEGPPPPEIDAAIRKLMAELEPVRLYQPSSTDGHGVHSSGPYYWRPPSGFYKIDAAFKTETGSVSVPTLESIHAMLPRKDWEIVNDDWAEHDFASGAQRGDKYIASMTTRYGAPINLADFGRKAQLMNYEAFRSMYEGREAALFAPSTGILTWMSNPAQPSFVWQIYSHDLEPMSSLYAVKSASEPMHVALNEVTGEPFVVNETPNALKDAHVTLTMVALDGKQLAQQTVPVALAPADAATKLPALKSVIASAVDSLPASSLPASTPAASAPAATTADSPAVYFLRLELLDSANKLLSTNTYWRGVSPENMTALTTLPTVALEASATRRLEDGQMLIQVTLKNPTPHVALMAHVQLRRADGERVLPAYASENYVTLLPHESVSLQVSASEDAFEGHNPLLAVDGFNVTVNPTRSQGVTIQPNPEADPEHWPVTMLPTATLGLR